MALGKAVVNIIANLEPLKRGLAQAQSAIKRAFTGAGSKSLTLLGATVTRVTQSLVKFAKVLGVTVVAAIGASIKAASDFQTQMQLVNTMLDDKADPIMGKFKNTVSEMSKDFGQSTKVLTKGLFDILSASIDATEATEVLGVASKAAVAGATDVATTTSALLSIIKSYGMEAGDALAISDKMFASFKRGRFEIGELAGSIGRVASTANTAGLSLDELLALISTVTRGGIKMDEAVTSVNAVMTAFLKPQKAAVQAAEEFGLEISSTTLKTLGFVEVVKKLTEATPEQLAAIVPNVRGFKAFARAVLDIKGLQEDLALISEDSAGRTQKAYDKMVETVGFKTKQLKTTITALAVSFGDPLLEPMGRLIDGIVINFNELSDVFRHASGSIGAWGDKFVEVVQIAEGEIRSFLHNIEAGGIIDTFKDIGQRIIESIKTWFVEHQSEIEEAGVLAGIAIGKGISKGVGIAAKNLLPKPDLATSAPGPSFGSLGFFAPPVKRVGDQ